MENKFLIDLSIKYGLKSTQISKLVDMLYQCGLQELEDPVAQKIAHFICSEGLVDKPGEEVIEELKRNKFVR